MEFFSSDSSRSAESFSGNSSSLSLAETSVLKSSKSTTAIMPTSNIPTSVVQSTDSTLCLKVCTLVVDKEGPIGINIKLVTETDGRNKSFVMILCMIHNYIGYWCYMQNSDQVFFDGPDDQPNEIYNIFWKYIINAHFRFV